MSIKHLRNVVNNRLSAYISNIAKNYVETSNDYTIDDLDDLIYDKDFQDFVQKDLEKAGFSSADAGAIAIQEFPSNEAIYKFLAYTFKLYDTYKNVEELKELIITNIIEIDINNFTEEDLAKIVKENKKLF